MVKQDTRQRLLAVGEQLMLERGYHSTGLSDIVNSAGVPKGSFYHFFASKEAFAMAVLDQHFQDYDQATAELLTRPDLPPLIRIQHFFLAARDKMQQQNCEGGCLVGNLAQEMSDQDESFRLRLEQIMRSWQTHIARCLQEARDQGQLPDSTEPTEMARFLLNSWEGALMRSKVTKSIESLDNFMSIIFSTVLKTE